MRPYILALYLLLALAACSPKEFYAPELWEGTRYDDLRSATELQEHGWKCAGWEEPDSEGLDASCRVRTFLPEPTIPDFTIFGVPRAAASVFLRKGYTAYINIQLHGSSGVFIADNFTRLLGAPEKTISADGSCSLVWRSQDHSYKLYLGNGDPTKYLTLFAAPSAYAFNDLEATDFKGFLKSELFRLPCARY